MREKIEPREFWNRRSQHYDEQSGAAYADAYRKTAECIRPYLTPNDRVLDFACGTGLVTLPVAQMAAEVCAIDISDEMVRHLKKKIAEQGVGNVSASCMDLFDDSLRPGSFDAVVACNVPDHALMLGVPAQQRGWVCECGQVLHQTGISDYRCPDCGRTYQLKEEQFEEMK